MVVCVLQGSLKVIVVQKLVVALGDEVEGIWEEGEEGTEGNHHVLLHKVTWEEGRRGEEGGEDGRGKYDEGGHTHTPSHTHTHTHTHTLIHGPGLGVGSL